MSRTQAFWGDRKPGTKEPAGQGGRILWVAVAIVAFAILVGPALRNPPSFRSDIAGTGYPRIVDSLIDLDFLKVEERPDTDRSARIIFDEAVVGRSVADAVEGSRGGLGECRYRRPLRDAFSEPLAFAGNAWAEWTGAPATTEDCLDLLSRLRAATFLGQDMRVDSSDIWRWENDELSGMAPGAHIISDATRAYSGWRGSLLFRKPYVPAMLVDPVTRKVLLRFDPSLQSTMDFVPSRAIQTEARSATTAIANLQSADARCRGSAQASLLGDKLLLTLLPVNRTSDCPDIYVDNRLVHSGSSATGRPRYVLLEPGQIVTVGESRPVMMQFVHGLGGITVLNNGRRRYEPTLAQVGAAVANASPEGDLLSSIDPQLHFKAQRLLENQAGSIMREQGASLRAAALLIDGLTGEIVAAPTFPAQVDQLAPSDRYRASRLGWLGQNQNFQRLPAGSTAKVPIATAIVQRYPELLTLRAQARPGPFGTLLGTDLKVGGNPVAANVRGGSIDFETFIAKSSNYYALLLMRLAASPEPLASDGPAIPANEAYSILGRTYRNAPALPRDGRQWATSWGDILYRMTCVPPTSAYEAAEDSKEICPEAYFDHSKVDNPGGLAPLAHVPPDLEFDFIRPEFIYQDYLQSILGQSRSLWTNAALGQAYSRILTGRQVSLHFDARSSGPGDFEPLGIRREVWQAVTQGMAGAASSGTASALSQASGSRFDDIAIYAKTGTPTVAIDGQSRTGHAIAVAFVRYDGPRSPDTICSTRVAVVNIQGRTEADRQPALSFVRTLMSRQEFANWLAAPCPPKAPQPQAGRN
ncbi:hypothetical protein [Qipengyuania sp. JC766]|uniref:hypothetical protein n=1 Tax=Qipengyuania sp. JC766 TaxID=3232139 RepID=UPI003458CE2C